MTASFPGSGGGKSSYLFLKDVLKKKEKKKMKVPTGTASWVSERFCLLATCDPQSGETMANGTTLLSPSEIAKEAGQPKAL